METWVAVDKDGTEICSNFKPERNERCQTWECIDFIDEENWWADYTELPKGSIKKLIGRDLTWADEPVELKGE